MIFLKNTFPSIHQYRQNALLDATVALTGGASLSLTSPGRYLPGNAHVKHKIKRMDRLLGNATLQEEISFIYRQITSQLTHCLTFCVIAVDWSGYPAKEYFILRASLLCDGRSLPLMTRLVCAEKQNNTQIQNEFLDELYQGIGSDKQVVIVTDAGFQTPWFHKIHALGWVCVGRVRGGIKFNLTGEEEW